MRRRFQGVANILHFNWPLFAAAVAGAAIAIVIALAWDSPLRWLLSGIVALAIFAVVVSLMASWWLYDHSPLYELPWLEDDADTKVVVNIHAGFDETSETLRLKFPEAEIFIWDFYDPARHTEASIRRARVAFPPAAGSVSISADSLPLHDGAADVVCVFMAAHEIRQPEERDRFFRELHRILRPGGKVFVTEHLRDLPNALAYSLGVLHFHPQAAWRKSFAQAGLNLMAEIKTTPLVSTFVLARA